AEIRPNCRYKTSPEENSQGMNPPYRQVSNIVRRKQPGDEPAIPPDIKYRQKKTARGRTGHTARYKKATGYDRRRDWQVVCAFTGCRPSPHDW
ncbi:MAG: hypothetical protein WBF70_11970, partial [Aeromonas molluscorum]